MRSGIPGAGINDSPIRLACLSSGTVEGGTYLKLKYSFPDVDHPIYGKASGLEGELPFILPHGYEII